MVLAIVVTWVLTMASAVFLRKSLKEIDSGLGIRRLSIAALLYLIGAILLFTGMGFLIVLIAQIVLAIAFISIPGQKGGPPSPPPQPVPPSPPKG
jgi:uncharacterized membrane protein